MSYTYAVDAATYSERITVDADHFGQINEGQAITVRALHSAAAIGQWPRIAGHSPLLELGGKWLMSLFWCGVVSIFVWLAYVRPWQNWRTGAIRSASPGDRSRDPGANEQGNQNVPHQVRVRGSIGERRRGRL